MARQPGTPSYEDTYRRSPHLREIDDRLRALPPLLEPGSRHFDPARAASANRYFEAIDGIVPDPARVEAWAERLSTAADLPAAIRDLTARLGAVATGFAPLDEAFVYLHKGRLDTDYGRAVRLDHDRVIVFLVEMDHAAMRQAPRAPVIEESALQYYRAAVVAKTLEAVLCRLGWQSRAHYDAHYDVILPPLAVAAGLGEVGRNNILIAERFGARVRIGAVTTEAPLPTGRPRSLGVAHFCSVCKKCATSCPSRSLSIEGKKAVRGVMKWTTAVERCYAFWRTTGSDCGICMAVCPFSHRDTWPHRLMRWLVRRVPIIHRPAVWLDDLVYGRRWKGNGAAD